MANTDKDWLEWLAQVMSNRPKGNGYIDSERGIQIGTLCLNLNKEMFSWRRADPDVFWIDVQLYTKYNLSDDDVKFVERMQAGVEQFKLNADERHAYSEMMRGIQKLKQMMIDKIKD